MCVLVFWHIREEIHENLKTVISALTPVGISTRVGIVVVENALHKWGYSELNLHIAAMAESLKRQLVKPSL